MKTRVWSMGRSSAVAGACVLAVMGLTAAAQAQGWGDGPPPGSYQASCRNMQTTIYNGVGTLKAECRTVRGDWMKSSLRFTDCRTPIENHDGQLSCIMGGPPPGSGYGNGGYGNGGYGNGGYGNGGYGNGGYGNGGYGNGGYGNGGYGNGGYGNGGYGNGGYGGGYGNGGYGNGGYNRPPPRPVSGGNMTLFTGPNFGGAAFGTSREITNLPRQYNDQAISLKIGRGAWEVCTDSDFRGRCQVFDRDVPDLNRFGMAQAISSMRQVR